LSLFVNKKTILLSLDLTICVFGFVVLITRYNFDGFVKSRRCCHCERSEAISLAVTG